MVKPGTRYSDALSVGLEERDLLIIRTDKPMTLGERRQLDDALRKTNPQWQGPLLIMGTDQIVEKMPEDALRALYVRLHALFGPKKKQA